MASQPRTAPHDTIWELPDSLWWCLESIINERYPQKSTGRPRADLRQVLNGIIFRMRTGCQWNKLPENFGSDSTVHRWFQQFCKDGIFETLWAQLAETCDELGGVSWEWQSADGRLGKARFGGEKGREKSHGSRQAGHQDQPVGR
jgi:putative transposase